MLNKDALKFELDHIGIAVQNLQKSVAFYQAAFGFTAGSQETLEKHGVKIAFLPVVAEPQAARLELLEACVPDSPLAKFVVNSATSLHHLALRVDDLEKAIDHLQGLGLELINSPEMGADGCRCVFVHPRSTGGVLLELLQRD